MTTTADRIREMIQAGSDRVERCGEDLFSHGSEHVNAVWMEIDARLKAADLCELLCEERRMYWHLETVKMLLSKVEFGMAG